VGIAHRNLEYKNTVKMDLEDEIMNVYYKCFSNSKHSNILFVLDMNMYHSVFKYAVAMLLNQDYFISFESNPSLIHFTSKHIRERVKMILKIKQSSKREEKGVQLENIYSLIPHKCTEYVLIMTNTMKYGYDSNIIEKYIFKPKCIYWNMKPNTPLHFFDVSSSFETILMGYDVESMPFMFDLHITNLNQIMYKVLDSSVYKSIHT